MLTSMQKYTIIRDVYKRQVSNSFKDQVPDTYIRKQTLVNGERYITQELKDLEHDILSASDRVSACLLYTSRCV